MLEKKPVMNLEKKMSISRTGKKKKPLTYEKRLNISLSKVSYNILTPWKVYNSMMELEKDTGISVRSWTNILNKNLNVVPRNKLLKILKIENKEKRTWGELGFKKYQCNRIPSSIF